MNSNEPLFSTTIKRQFEDNGYVIVPKFFELGRVNSARDRFPALFRGEFETGVQPDEWNWRDGVSDPKHSRQICNGWKSDRTIANLVLDERVGEWCARLMEWPGARINQDNVIWKTPGSKPLGFHQDNSYQQWIVPSSMMTCWIALDKTSASGGTIEYVRGSHRWPITQEKFPFHAPDDYHEGLSFAANKLGVTNYEIDKIEVNPGDVVFHHGSTWHGSGSNDTDNPRRSVVSHCIQSDARFHPTETSQIYSRYKRFNDEVMDESYFPVLWTQSSARSKFLAHYLLPESSK